MVKLFFLLLALASGRAARPRICHVEEIGDLSVAKQAREFNDRHGKDSANRKQSTSLLECSAEVQPILCKNTY